LERLLGAMLVERSKRSVRFTALGEDVVTRARDVVRAAEDLCAVAEGAREPLVGPLRLGVIPTIAPFLLPQLLTDVATTWPRLRLFVRETLTGPACEALARGTLDCVLLALPAACGEIDAVEIATDRLLLAVGASDHDPGMSLDGIDPARLLLLEDGHCLRDHALAACDLAPATDAPLVASTLHTLVQLVDAGLGITLLPKMAIDAGILRGTGVSAYPLPSGRTERRIALAWRRDHPREAEFRLLGENLQRTVGASRPLRPASADAAVSG
jgi:LysR family hydrogen peroxide-inducible transcriptional activator